MKFTISLHKPVFKIDSISVEAGALGGADIEVLITGIHAQYDYIDVVVEAVTPDEAQLASAALGRLFDVISEQMPEQNEEKTVFEPDCEEYSPKVSPPNHFKNS